MRHMHEYGTTSEQLAEIAVATRKWAQLNPTRDDARRSTIDDVLASRWIAYPFHIYDCCLVTDAGGAVVVTSAPTGRAISRRSRCGCSARARRATHQSMLGMPDMTTTPARYSGKAAFEMAGVTHDDIDVCGGVRLVHVHGAACTLEELGFCGRARAGRSSRTSARRRAATSR